MVKTAGDWAWSSYAAHIGKTDGSPWLDIGSLHGFVLGRDLVTTDDHAQAAAAYAQLVASAPDASLWGELQQQIYLGDVTFIERMQALTDAASAKSTNFAKPQRSSPLTLADWLARSATREQALRMAHRESGITMSALAAELGLSAARVSQLIKRAEGAG